MDQVLLVLKDKEMTEILRTKIAQLYGVEVIGQSTAAEAKSLLAILPEIGIVICNEEIDKEHTAFKICEFLLENKEENSKKVRVVLIGKKTPPYPHITNIGVNPTWQKLVAYTGFLLGKEKHNIIEVEAKRERDRKREEEMLQLAAGQADEVIGEHNQYKTKILEKEKEEKRKLVEERIARGIARQEKLDQEKLEKENAEKEKVAKELAAQEKLLKEKNERERLEKEKIENERIEKASLAAKKIEAEKLAQEKILKERLEQYNKRLEKKNESEKTVTNINIPIPEKPIDPEIQKLKEEETREKIERGKEKIAQMAREKKAAELAEENEKTTVFRLPSLTKVKVEVLKEQSPANVDYIPLSLIYFLNVTGMQLEFSIYSRIKKNDGFEYNKKINSGVKISSSDLQRVLVRAGKELFIDPEESEKANSFLNTLFLKRFKKEKMTILERMKLNSDAYEILLELFKTSNFNKYNIEIIKEIIKSIDQQVKTKDALPHFLAGMKARKLSYGYCHSYLTFFFLLQVVDHFEWCKDHSKNKLLYLSLFHDLTLNSDRLIKLHHNYFQEIKNLNDDDIELINEHATAAAFVLENIVKAPKELTTLIREHHGLKSGKGLVESLSIAISPTNMAFIVIEDFVTQFLEAIEKLPDEKASGPKKEQMVQIFTLLKKKYDRLTYQEVVLQLQKNFKISL